MKNNLKRVLSLVLAFSMVFSYIPTPVYATSASEDNIIVTESDQTAEDAGEEGSHEHSYAAVVTDPTCTEKGYTTYTCECEDSYTADEVDALGHSYADGVCSVCGEAEPDAEQSIAVVTEDEEATSTLPQAEVSKLDPKVLAAGEYQIWNGSLVDGTADLPLEVLMNFKATETWEDAKHGGYGNWLTDFYLSFEGIEGDSLVADNCYLAGNYGSFGWIAIPTDGVTIQNNVEYPIVSQYDATLNYKDICTSVQDFTAAIHIDKAILEANPNMKVTLKLKITNPDTKEVIQIGDAYTYDAKDLSYKPQATVSVLEPVTLAVDEYQIWNGSLSKGTEALPLEIVMKFATTDTVEEAKLSGYSNWKTDFYLTFTDLAYGSITADNSYLAGNYGSYGWIVIPTDSIVLEEGVTYPVVAAYDANITYKQICESVKEFTAAIHIDEAILEANPDMKVKLELRMTNPGDANDYYAAGEPAVYTVADLMGNQEEETAGPVVTVPDNSEDVAFDDEDAKDEFKEKVSGALAEAYGKTENKLTVAVKEYKNTDTEKTVTYDIKADGYDVGDGLEMSLPVVGIEKDKTAYVVHTHTTEGETTKYVYEAKVDENGNVTFTNKVGFSDFTVTVDGLATALAAGGDVVLGTDITLTESVTVTGTVTLDLNGKTITGTPTETVAFAVITNKGTLTINDTVGGGAIVCDHKLEGSTTYAVNTILNQGTLTVNGGTIENKSTATYQIGYAIDNNSTSSNAVVEINGGTIRVSGSNYYDGIRQFCNSETYENSVTVNGGTVYSIWLQNPSDGTTKDTKDVNGSTTINGGTVSAVYLEPSSNFDAAITGGTIGSVEYFTTSEDRDLAGFISGGTFTKIDNSASMLKDGYELVTNDDGTYGVQEKTLSGSGTEEAPYLISTLDDLILFRDSVNADETKYNAAGVYVALGADIDMAGTDWSVNIGDDCSATFDGIFDGKGYTISNLTSTETAQKGDGYICTGLFGAIYGSAVVKNFTLKNVTINTGEYTGNNVGAVVGFAYNCTGSVENVTVKGDISINAEKVTGVGAIVGYDYYGKLTVKNCSVIGNDGSAITGRSYVGGVIGYASTNFTADSNTVENITITAEGGGAGGIAGIALGNSVFNNNKVKNVAVSAEHENWKNSAAAVVGTITSTTTVTETKVENVTANGEETTTLVGSEHADKPTEPLGKVEAAIGDVTYATLAAALKAATNGDTIELLADIEASEVLLIDKSVTINGNNHKVTSSATRVFRVTTSDVEVTLNDVNMVSTAVMVYPNDVRGISIDGSLSNVKLTLNNCSVDFTDETACDWSYAVNVVDNGTYHTVTVNGGTYEGANVINVRGANITVVVKDATLNCLYPDSDRYCGACIWVLQEENSIVEATGNTFNGTNAVALNVGTGTTVTESDNTDNTTKIVAKIGDTYYTSLAEAMATAKDGDTVTLLSDLTMSEILVINKAITLDGNGKTLTSTAGRAINVSGADGVTIKNLTINASGERAINVIQSATNVTIDNVTATAANYTVNVASSAANAVVTITNSDLTGLNVVNVAAANAQVTVSDTKITCNDQTEEESYIALCLNKDATGATITATDITFDIKDDSLEAVVTAENGTITIDGSTDEVVVQIAYISYGDNYYGFTSLERAFNKAKDGEKIVLIRDFKLTESVTIPAGKTVILDLNGKTITGTDSNTSGNFYLINNNKGNLTIVDSSDEATGKITLTAVNDRGWSGSSVVVANNLGTVTLKSGTIEHLGGTSMAYGIDNLTNGANTVATLNIEGGTVDSTYFAIRQFANNGTNNLNISGGTVGYVWMQSPNTNANVVNISVTGGEVDGICLTGKNAVLSMEVEPNTTGIVYGTAPAGMIITGTAETGFGLIAAVASVTDSEGNVTNYATLAEAMAAVKDGDTVTLLSDAIGDVEVAEGNNIVIDLNGYDIVGTEHAITNNGTLTINDSVGTGNVYTTDVSAQGRATVVNNGTLTINAGWFGDSNNDTTDRNAINRGNAIKNDGTATINGGYFTNVSNQYIDSSAYAYAINTLAGGTTTINYATIYGDINGLIYSDGKTIVNDGSFTLGRPNEENNLWYLAYGDVEIKGGTWTRAFAVPSWNTGDPKFCGDVEVSAGIFNVTVAEEYCADGFIPTSYTDDEGNTVYGVKVGTYVAQVGDVKYEKLQAAFEAVEDGETITLLGDVTITEETAVITGLWVDGVAYKGDKSFTVDFGGFTVTDDGCVNDYLIYLNNKGDKDNEITFKNGTIVAKNGCWATVCVNGASSTYATVLNLNDMNITNSNDASYNGNLAVRARNKATVNVNENTVITSDGASYGVAASAADAVVNINSGATVIQKNSGTSGGNSVFAAVGGTGTVNIYDGAVIESDKYGVHTMTTGTPVINVYGGTITAPVALKASTNGGTGELATINVTGGTINGTLEHYTENGIIAVSGGAFSETVAEEYCAEGYIPTSYTDDEGNTVHGVKVGTYVAQVGDVKYETVTEALAGAANGDTVTLLADSVEAGLVLANGVTLDLNGFTLTADYVAAFAGNYIVDNSTDKTGLLKVAENKMALMSLDADSKQIPVWNEVDGYIFLTVKEQQMFNGTVTEDKFIYMFRPSQATFNELMKNGASDNGLKVKVRLSWDDASGVTGSKDFVYSDELVGTAYETGYPLTLTVTGFNSYLSKNLKVSFVVEFGTLYIESTPLSVSVD